MSSDHLALVTRQFGPRAQAYVESTDHSVGRDLERLRDLVAQRPGGHILDLGCGGGHVSFTVAPYAAEVVAYDLSEDMLAAVRVEAARRGLSMIHTQQGSAEHLPFPDASFDQVLTRFSAHHWFDLAAGLSEMRRVLRPGGVAVVMDTIAPTMPRHDTFLQAIEVLRDPSHVRDYSLPEWAKALEAAGFRPSAPLLDRLPLAFESWVRRIGTPAPLVQAIRALQDKMPADVRAYFAIEPDGSFLLDTMTIAAET